MLDAFSSDAVPAHLLTREAFELYQSKLRPGGVLLLKRLEHLPRRPLRRDCVGPRHRHDGLHASDGDLDGIPKGDKETSSWVAMSSDPEALAFLADDDRWEPIEELGPGTLWTDDFSDILSVIR